MVAIGFLSGLLLCLLRRHAYQMTVDEIGEWLPKLMIIGLVGAKLAFFIYFPSLLFVNPLQALTYPGGLVLYGGIIAGLLGLLWWAKTKHVSFWRIADFMSIPMLAGLAFGRMGCFLSGCCYGSPCTLPWAVQYPIEHASHPAWVHPAPLYASILSFILLGILWKIERSSRPIPVGHLSSLFLIGYGCIRIGLEALRDDRIVWWNTIPFSASQWVSLVGIIIGVFLWWRASTQPQTPSSLS